MAPKLVDHFDDPYSDFDFSSVASFAIGLLCSAYNYDFCLLPKHLVEEVASCTFLWTLVGCLLLVLVSSVVHTACDRCREGHILVSRALLIRILKG